MKNVFLFSLAMLSPALCLAQNQTGRVLSTTPVTQQVALPQQVCSTDQVLVQQPKTGAGAFLGAAVGGGIANAAVHGPDQVAATVLGAVGGALLGNAAEQPSTQVQDVQRCNTQTVYENRTVAYNVIYEYAGKKYSVQLPDYPGTTLPLQVTVAADGSQVVSPVITVPAAASTQPVYAQQPSNVVVVSPPPVYAAPYPYYYPYAPAVSIGIGVGYCCGGYYRGGYYHGGYYYGRGHWH